MVAIFGGRLPAIKDGNQFVAALIFVTLTLPVSRFEYIDTLKKYKYVFALRFDYGRYNEVLSAMEVGLNAEYYTKDMRIMLNIPNKQFFFNAYIALVFGKRKNVN